MQVFACSTLVIPALFYCYNCLWLMPYFDYGWGVPWLMLPLSAALSLVRAVCSIAARYPSIACPIPLFFTCFFHAEVASFRISRFVSDVSSDLRWIKKFKYLFILSIYIHISFICIPTFTLSSCFLFPYSLLPCFCFRVSSFLLVDFLLIIFFALFICRFRVIKSSALLAVIHYMVTVFLNSAAITHSICFFQPEPLEVGLHVSMVCDHLHGFSI